MAVSRCGARACECAVKMVFLFSRYLVSAPIILALHRVKGRCGMLTSQDKIEWIQIDFIDRLFVCLVRLECSRLVRSAFVCLFFFLFNSIKILLKVIIFRFGVGVNNTATPFDRPHCCRCAHGIISLRKFRIISRSKSWWRLAARKITRRSNSHQTGIEISEWTVRCWAIAIVM